MLLHLYSAVCWLLRIRVILEPDSLGCNGHGDMDACGQCICEKNYFGNACECYYSETLQWGPQNTSAAIAECTPNDVEDALVCSGKGKCHCGHCRCFPTKSNPNERYSGRFCECDDYSCPCHDNMICGGHGRCHCGKCVCNEGFTGEACECSTSQDTCMSSNGQICNGKGACVCGVCECEVGSPYKGPTCEDCPPIVEMSSVMCNNHGSLDSCGQCICEESYYGNNCECEEDLTALCISPDTTSSIPCSGRGECICGMCSCFARRAHSAQKYSGRYCECDDYSCSYHNNQLCGGHGRCICGKCMCDDGYSGDACECPLSQNSCFTDGGVLCNGVGNCVCGVCECDAYSHYRGPTCEECPTCPGQCQKYRECILCKVFGRGQYSAEECVQKCPLVEIVDKINEEEVMLIPNMNLCRYTDADNGMSYFFTYKYGELNKIHLTAQKTMEADNMGNLCMEAMSCEECFNISSTCGWYKHLELPSNIRHHCDLLNNHLQSGISADDILTSATSSNVTILEPASMMCMGRGSLDTCGQCECEPEYYGKRCECDASYGVTSEEARSQCINPRSADYVLCSGRGECICGMCSCLPRRSGSPQRFTGQYCECDDYSCPYHSNRMCGGNGQCVCGECQCYPGFEGDSCDCPTALDTCMSRDGKICNGQGECVCGVCVCDGSYRGRTCEECPTCPGPCMQYKDCVLCHAFGSGPYNREECRSKCSMDNILLVDTLDIDGENRDENLCSFIDYSDNTRIYFKYAYDENYKIEIKVQRVKIYNKA
ncbi:integrin beta-like protein 1 [Mercenaria mercenaria]|uniref:integrin beta-like protein 1 n=1 Tax=Mercenaria mercenaria TaxID=6596 RepID=UPI00234F151B|nr:integrin beta-like protein 1 [Mercenaria mercenaria]